jgi:arylsulfatase
MWIAKSYNTPEGGANHYNNLGVLPQVLTSIYRENGEESEWPKGAYSTDFYTDKLIEYIKSDQGDGKPFFTYAAYTSPHWPLQVSEKFWRKYEGNTMKATKNLKKNASNVSKKPG